MQNMWKVECRSGGYGSFGNEKFYVSKDPEEALARYQFDTRNNSDPEATGYSVQLECQVEVIGDAS